MIDMLRETGRVRIRDAAGRLLSEGAATIEAGVLSWADPCADAAGVPASFELVRDDGEWVVRGTIGDGPADDLPSCGPILLAQPVEGRIPLNIGGVRYSPPSG